MISSSIKRISKISFNSQINDLYKKCLLTAGYMPWPIKLLGPHYLSKCDHLEVGPYNSEWGDV